MVKRARGSRRRELKALVDGGDVAAIVAWARRVKDAPALLVPRVFDLDPGKRWVATVALAETLGEVARRGDVEAVRVIVRRFLWNMMEESGGLAWHGPEAIAEILVEVPELIAEYGRITAAYVDEEPFGPGALYLIARLAARAPELFDDLVPRVTDALGWDDPFARAQALLALAALRPGAARRRALLLLEDRSRVPVYDRETARVGESTVGETARRVAGSAEAEPGEAERACG